MNQDRYIWVDIAKAICIVLVVLGHYNPDGSPEWYKVINRLIYSFHMPLFLFASGFIYAATKRDEERYLPFISKKVKRLMIPYFSTSIIIITLKFLTQGSEFVENPITPLAYIEMFYKPSAGYFLWYVWALFLMFLLIPFFKNLRSRLILLSGSLALYFWPIHFPQEFCLEQFRIMLVYFVLGVILYDQKIIWKKILHPYAITGAAIGFIGAFTCRIIYTINTLWILFFISVLGILITCKIAMNIERKKGKIKHYLLLIASSSYIIYLFHTTFQGFAKSILHKFSINSQDPFIFIASACITIAAGLICPILLDRLILQKYKISRFLFGMK